MTMSLRRVSLAALAVAAILLIALLPTEDCAPARSKPWRRAPEPEAEAQRSPSSTIAAAEAERIEARKRRSHTLRIHMDAEPRHLNPMVAPSVWTVRAAQDTIFETLIRYEPPESGTGPGLYRPGLAETWRIAPGGREIRIELADDVVFHDGARMSSVDVQFSLDAARNPRIGADHLRRDLRHIIAVELISPRALRIRLEHPSGYVLRALAQVPILPAHIYERNLTASRGPVIGTGPYRLESWEDNVIRLTRFDKYWGNAPAVANIEFVYDPDAASALTAAKRGEIDLIPALIHEHYPEQASAPGLVSSFRPLRLRPPGLRYLVMDAGEPPLDDVRVRQALSLLIDRKALIKEIYNGLARPVAGPIWPGGPGNGTAPSPPEYDPAKAGVLLDAAGWRDSDGDGIRERDGVRLRLSMLVSDKTDDDSKAEQESITRNFRRLGILIDQRAGAAAVLRNRLEVKDFDLAFVDWRGTVDQDLSPLFETGGADNFGRFSQRQIDAVLAELSGMWEPAARAPLMNELGRLLAESWPIATIAAPDPYGLVHRRVSGVVVWDGWIALRDVSLSPVGD